ncbi:MAG: flavodoxin family protein [Spirochaetota bacterium]
MNVCILAFNHAGASKFDDIIQGLAKGIGANGHRVDIINGLLETGKKVSFYDYIVLGTTAAGSFGGSIPQSISAFLGQCGTVTGKRSFAFVHKGGLRKHKTLKKLMSSMEHEGMFLKYSEIISNADEAVEIGKRLHIK